LTELELLERLHANLLAVASSTKQVQRIGPFTAFLDPLRPIKYLSWALPDPHTAAQDLAAALPDVVEHYRAHDRNARTEHFEDVCPALAGVVEAAGWTLSERVAVMVCTQQTLVMPPPVDGLVVEPVGPDAPEDTIRAYIETQVEAFGDKEESPSPEVIARWRERAARENTYAGFVDGRLVGTAAALQPAEGATEVVGVTTLHAYRRRGIGATLTATAVAASFAEGTELAWLSAADEAAGRIYTRAGFRLTGWQRGYDAPAA
jgi:predicted GNAT family acetyltransferase